ncbi:hypothetical protein GCM10025789_10810 [Tessaracoccus lubricantis]|uniref:Uncharacterized protein n=1 Tax=Tessaracoccus lubricantis TaxID=545543 RepID=A0ABP9F7T7_9ACTN
MKKGASVALAAVGDVAASPHGVDSELAPFITRPPLRSFAQAGVQSDTVLDLVAGPPGDGVAPSSGRPLRATVT